MNVKMIFNGEATVEELNELNKCGYSFVIESGQITHILKGKEVEYVLDRQSGK